MEVCFLCGNKSRKLFSKKGDAIGKTYNLDKCDNCEFVFVKNRPSEKELNAYYNKQQGVLLSSEGNVLRKAKKFLRLVKKGKLLEVGSSYGFFLWELKKRGWKVKGLELSEETSDHSRKRYGLNVETGSLKTAKFSEKFDIVVMFDVIEHVLNPVKEVRLVNEILNKNGFFVLTTPNVNSFMAKINRKEWEWFIPPAHLNYFSPKSLKKMLEDNNFKVEYLGTYRGDARTSIYAILISLVKKIGLFDFLKRRVKKGLEERGEIKLKDKEKYYSYFDLLEFLTYPIYAIFYPLIFVLYKFGLGESMFVIARKR